MTLNGLCTTSADGGVILSRANTQTDAPPAKQHGACQFD